MEIHWKFNPDDPDDAYKLKLYNQAQGMYSMINEIMGGYNMITEGGVSLRDRLKHDDSLTYEEGEIHRWYQHEFGRLAEENDIDLSL